MTTFLSDPAEILFAAAEHIERYGHNVGDFAPAGRGLDPQAPCCAGGAINVVTAGHPCVADLGGDPLAAQLAKAALADHLRLTPIDYLYELNHWEEAVRAAEEAGVEFTEPQPEPYDAGELIAKWNDGLTEWQVIRSLRAVATYLAGAEARRT